MLYLIRHGQTAFNKEPSRIRGWLDVPLSQAGEKEAQAVAMKMSKADPAPTAVFSSSLQRAVSTADAISNRLGIPHHIDDRLRPWNLGALAGNSVKASEHIIRHWVTNPDAEVPNGESYRTFAMRWMDALDHHFGSSTADSIPALVTSHSNLMTARDLLDGRIPHYREHAGPETGQYSIVHDDGEIEHPEGKIATHIR